MKAVTGKRAYIFLNIYGQLIRTLQSINRLEKIENGSNKEPMSVRVSILNSKAVGKKPTPAIA